MVDAVTRLNTVLESRHGVERVLMTLACLAAWNVPTAQAQQQITDRWSRMADMNEPHELHAAVAVDGKIYVVGGNTYLSRGPAAFEAFDPEANTWQTLPEMPTPRDFPGVAAIQNRIFAVGGISRSVDAHATVEVYDLAENTWTKVMDLPTPRNRLAAAAVSGRIFAIGGHEHGSRHGHSGNVRSGRGSLGEESRYAGAAPWTFGRGRQR